MFKSVSDIAAERRLSASGIPCGSAVEESGRKEINSDDVTEVPSPAAVPQQEGVLQFRQNGARAYEALQNGHRDVTESAISPKLSRQYTPYELERQRERDWEQAWIQQKSDRIKMFEMHIARTKGNGQNSLETSGDLPRSMSQRRSPLSVLGRTKQGLPRTYGDMVSAPDEIAEQVAQTGQADGATVAHAVDVQDQDSLIAIYFDDEIRLLCQFPSAVRALRRDLVADLSKSLRVQESRFSLVGLYEGPVAEVVIEKCGNSPIGSALNAVNNESLTSLELAERLSEMTKRGRPDKPRGKNQEQVQKSKYFRNICNVKIRGVASAVRSLSVMLRPLEDVIHERLSYIEKASVDMSEYDRATEIESEGQGLEKPVDESCLMQPSTANLEMEKMFDISSDDDDADSLAYTASVLTNLEEQHLNPDIFRSQEQADSCTTISSDEMKLDEVVSSRKTSPPLTLQRRRNEQEFCPDLSPASPLNGSGISELPPLAEDLFLEIRRARGLPQAENGGFLPNTFACASLLFADEFVATALPIDHAAGDELHDFNGAIGTVHDVESLPFKIRPQVRTSTYAGSVNPEWGGRFVITETRPSFMVLDGPNRTKRFLSSQRDVPLQGQNVLLLVTVHEHQRFEAHRRTGYVILELKPGQPVNDWFKLYTRNGNPVPSSTGSGVASIKLRIAYPGSISDSQPPSERPSSLLNVTSDSSLSSTSFNQNTDESLLARAQSLRSDAHDGNGNSRPHFADGTFSTPNADVRNGNAKSHSYLEQVARRMFSGSRSKNKKPTSRSSTQQSSDSAMSLKIVQGGEISAKERALEVSRRSPRTTAIHQQPDDAGLCLGVVSCKNLPISQGQSHLCSRYVCASLLLLKKADMDVVSKAKSAKRTVTHDLRRSTTEAPRGADKKLRVFPQRKTKILQADQNPQWNEEMYFCEAMRIDKVQVLGNEKLNSRYVGREEEAFVVLVSVCDSFEFRSDRQIGSCTFTILPGQRVEYTMTLQEPDILLDDPDASRKPPSIRLRAFLNLPPVSRIGTVTAMSPTLFSPSVLLISNSPPGRFYGDRSFRDISDSDSEAEDNCSEMHSPSATPPSAPASAKSPSSAALRPGFLEASNVLPPTTTTLASDENTSTVVEESISGAWWSPARNRIVTQEHTTRKEPTYSELERAFMVRLASRRRSSSLRPDLSPNSPLNDSPPDTDNR